MSRDDLAAAASAGHVDGSAAGQTGATGTLDEDGLLRVRIVGMPLAVQRRAQQHADELVRELTLAGEGLRQRGDTRHLPSRLVELIEQLTITYAGFTAQQEQELADALARGDASVDLTYRLPPSVTDAVRALSDILDEADDYCRAGQHLLTLATPPDLVAYRRWFLEEFERQAAGDPPQTWAQYAELNL